MDKKIEMIVELKKEINELKYEKYENDGVRNFLLVVSITSILIILSMSVVYSDNYDIDDVVAPYLCSKHGLEFRSVEYDVAGQGVLENLKIHCINVTKQKQIDDGYLVED